MGGGGASKLDIATISSFLNPQTSRAQAFAPCDPRKTAFTLAEVLITLAIIGVVAALTIPSVVRNYRKTQILTQMKKTYSELQQAINLSQVDNGFLKEWEFGNFYSASKSSAFFDKYLKSYLKISRRCPDGNNGFKSIGDCGISVGHAAVNYLLANGSSISVSQEDSKAYIIIDVNGKKSPNLYGRDNFGFMFDNLHSIYPLYFPTFKGVTREQIINDGTVGCTTKKIAYPYHHCAALIMFDNWQIKDDYPW